MSAKIVRLDRAVRPDYDKVVAVLDETDGEWGTLWPTVVGAMMAFTLLRGSKDGDYTARDLQRAVDDLAIAFLALGAMLGRGGAAAAVLFDGSGTPAAG